MPDTKSLVFTLLSADLPANTLQVKINGRVGYNDADIDFSNNGNEEYRYGANGAPESDDCAQGQTNLGGGTYSIPANRTTGTQQVGYEIDGVDFIQPPPIYIKTTHCLNLGLHSVA